MANLHFGFTADNRNLLSAISQIGRGVNDMSAQIKNSGSELDEYFSRLTSSAMRFAGTLGVATGIKEFASQVMNTRGEFQKLEVAFETMLGSKQKSDALMQQIVHTAAITPFGLQEVAGGAKSLMAFGIQAEEVNETLTRLGDIASALSIPMGDMVYLYGTSMVQGRMYAQDLQQFMGRGIPLAEELAKQLGITKGEVKDAVSAGKIGAEEVKKAIWSMTDNGSMFGGLMERQSQTINGQIANIEDAIEVMFNTIGQSQEGVINFGLDMTSKLVENWQTVLTLVGGVAAAYGAQKGMLALADGFNGAQANFQYQTESAALEALLPSKNAEAGASEEQATAKAHLTATQTAHIEALRAEAQAYLDSLIAEESAAQNTLNVAKDKVDFQDREILGIQNLKESLLQEYDAAILAGDADKAQAVATDIATTETWLKEEAATAEALAEDLRTASVNAATASEARESAATAINTAQNAGNTASVGILTIAKEKLAIATQKVNAAINANKFALITGAVIALGYAVYKLATYKSDLAKAEEAAHTAAAGHLSDYHKEMQELKNVSDALSKAKKGTDEWKSAKDEAVAKFGNYLNNLDAEITKTGTLASSYNILAKNVRLYHAAKALEDYRKGDIPTQQEETLNKTLDKTYNKLSGNTIFAKVDKNGNIDWGNLNGNGGYKTKGVVLSKELKDKIQQSVADAVLSGDINKIPAKYRNYLGQAGLLPDIYQAIAGQKTVAAGEKNIAYRYGVSLDELNGVDTNKKTTTNDIITRSELKKKRDEEKKKLDELTKLYKSNKGVSRKALDDQQAAYDEAKKNFEKYEEKTKKQTGATAAQIASKAESVHGKLSDIIRKQAEEVLRIEEDYELERWQSRIDLMEDGAKKVEETERLNFRKEKINLERRRKEAIEAELNRQMEVFNTKEDEKAVKNKKYAKKVFKDSDIDQTEMDKIEARFANLSADLEAKQNHSVAQHFEKFKEALNEYLKEYGSYEEKRYAIFNEYEQKIAEATPGEAPLLKAQRKTALANLDFESWKESGAVALAFGDISNLSKETIAELIGDLEKYRDEIIKTFDPEKIKQYNDALTALKEAQINDSFRWADVDKIAPKLRERLKLEKEIAEREEQYVKANIEVETAWANVVSATNELEYAKLSGNQDLISIAESKYVEANTKLGEANKNHARLANDLDVLRQKHNELAKFGREDYETLSNGMKQLADNATKLAQVFDKDVADSISNVTELFSALEEGASEIYSAVKVLMVDTVKETADSAEKLVDNAGKAMGTTSNSVSVSIGVIEKASVILAIISAAIQLATAVFKFIQSSNSALAEAKIKSLDEKLKGIEKSLTAIEKAADKAYSWNKISKYNEEIEKLREKQSAILAKIEAERDKGKGLFGKVDKEAIEKYYEEYDKINDEISNIKEKSIDAVFGEDLKSAIEDFASTYADAWNSGESRALTARDRVREMMQDMVREAIKSAIESSAAMEQIRATAAEFFRDGVFDTAEQIQLERMAEELQAELDKQFANSADILKSKSYTQSASSRGFTAMQQETAEELNGRFTALQESNEAIRQMTATITRNISAQALSVDSLIDIERDALQVHLLNESHLSRISKYTQELSLIRASMDSIEKKLRGI